MRIPEGAFGGRPTTAVAQVVTFVVAVLVYIWPGHISGGAEALEALEGLEEDRRAGKVEAREISREVARLLEDAGLRLRTQEECSRSHLVTVDALISSFTEHYRAIAASVGIVSGSGHDDGSHSLERRIDRARRSRSASAPTRRGGTAPSFR